MISLKGSKTGKDKSAKVRTKYFIIALNKAQNINAIATKSGVKKQLSQRDLAKLLGITIGTVTKYLRGEVDPLNVGSGIQKNLASCLSMSLDSLMNFYSSGEIKSDLNADEGSSWIKENSKKDPKKIYAIIAQIGNALYNEQDKIDTDKVINELKTIDSKKINNDLRETWEKKRESNNKSIKEAWAALVKYKNFEEILKEHNIKIDFLQYVLVGYEDFDCKDIEKYEFIKKLNQIINDIILENE